MTRPLLRFSFWGASLPVAILWAISASSAQLPLASVGYFNPYQNPTNWGGWGSAIYQGAGAVVRNVNGTVPVDNVGGTQSLVLDSVNPPGGWWNVLFKVSGNSLNFLRTGTNPAVRLRLRWSAIPTNNAWNMNVFVEGAQVSLNSYLTASTSAWQEICIPASDFIAAKPTVDLTHVWLIGMAAAGNYRDHCVLNIAALDLVPSATQVTYTDFAKVNQVGYAPLMAKLGVVSWEPGTLAAPPSSFQILNATNSQIVLTGTLSKFVQPNIWQAGGWTLDGDTDYLADFSTLRAPGTYRLEVPALSARSADFVIATNAYQALFRDALRFFYYSRSGVAIAEPFAEGCTRAALYANNTNATYNYAANRGHYNFGANTNRDVHGCWFDAGDTHVDVPNTATACWFLLETFRDFDRCVPASGLHLPESNGQQGDLVPLISWGLDWLKRMQNADGSVHHYVLANPSGASLPQQVSDISSFATACAAAAFAKACALLGGVVPPAQSADWLSGAQSAWSWLQANPNMVQPRLPLQNGVDPGADDTSWGDATFDRRCRAFAAVELFEATGQATYNTSFVNQFNENGGSPINGSVFGGNQTGYGSDNVLTYPNHALNFAFMDYARSSRGVSPTVQTTLKNAFLHQADVLTNYTALSGYHIPMLYPGHLYWGSSGGVLAPSAMVLARAFQWTGNTNYHEAAVQALHFICGRNPVNRVFVSGYGDYQHSSDFFSQFWTNLAQLPPGYLGGNINVSGSAQSVVEYPWKRFINTQDADMTEPGVYWNSAFAWLVGYAVNDATLPELRAVSIASGFNVSWPLRSAPFALYTATNLVPPITWALVTNRPALSNQTCTVVLPANSTRASFYRLRAP
jgi:endoglucanase